MWHERLIGENLFNNALGNSPKRSEAMRMRDRCRKILRKKPAAGSLQPPAFDSDDLTVLVKRL
jgi:hypothetical protein